MCDPQTYRATLIDCDSYQVNIDGKNFFCRVGSPETTPLEHQGQDFDRVVRDEKSEAFSAAIIFFQCLMLGQHPYSRQGGGNPAENIKDGIFPYGSGKGKIPKGPWVQKWNRMAPYIQDLFTQAFRDGHKDQGRRPSLDTWKSNLNRYLEEMRKGQHDPQI